MEFLIAMLFASTVTMLHNGTRNYESCLEEDFEHQACWEAKQMYKVGKWGCEVQGLPFDGHSDCVKPEVVKK